jgi:hypothetical protein
MRYEYKLFEEKTILKKDKITPIRYKKQEEE